jgi:sugar phosphate isomerase/epimerase
LGVSTGACIDRPILDALESMHEGGVAGVEIGTPPGHFDQSNATEVTAVAARVRALALQAVSIHAPFGPHLDLAHPHEHHRRAGIDAILTSARAIAQLGGRLVVAHPSDLSRHDADIRTRLEHSASSLRALASSCRELGVQLAIESPLPHLLGGHADEFDWILRHVDADVGACLDTGHIALGRAWQQFLEVTRGRLVHVHASDNHGSRDDHLPPGEGCIDWSEIAASLHEVSFAGWVILELRCPGSNAGEYFRNAIARSRALLQASTSIG